MCGQMMSHWPITWRQGAKQGEGGKNSTGFLYVEKLIQSVNTGDKYNLHICKDVLTLAKNVLFKTLTLITKNTNSKMKWMQVE